MTKKFKTFNAVLLSAVLLGTVFAATNINQQANAFHDSGQIKLFSFGPDLWTDPASGGQVLVTLDVFEGCLDNGVLLDEHDMQWVYTVENLTYDPVPGVTNGFSGFQLIFPQDVPEIYNQQSPTIGGPWMQNTFSGVPSPPLK